MSWPEDVSDLGQLLAVFYLAMYQNAPNELWQLLEEQGTENEARLVGIQPYSHLGKDNRGLFITEERGIDKTLSLLKFWQCMCLKVSLIAVWVHDWRWKIQNSLSCVLVKSCNHIIVTLLDETRDQVLVSKMWAVSNWLLELGLLESGLACSFVESLDAIQRRWVTTTDLYNRIDMKLDPAHLPSLLDDFQQLLPPLCICARTS